MAWNLTRNNIIKMALRKVGAVAQGDEPYPEQLSEASDIFNLFLKNFNIGTKLWKVARYSVKLTETTTDIVGTDGYIYDCLRGHTSNEENRPVSGEKCQGYWEQQDIAQYTLWVTGTDYVIGDEIYVDNNGYRVYICNSDHTASAEFITDAADWTEEAAYTAWEEEVDYYNIGDVVLPTNVLEVMDVWYRETGGTNRADTPIELISGQRFMDIRSKQDATTFPDYVYVDKADGVQRLFLRKVPSDITSFELFVRVEQLLDDLVTPSDNPDVAMQYYDLFIYGLAVKLAPDYGVPIKERNSLKTELVELVNLYKQRNKEDVDLEMIEPAF